MLDEKIINGEPVLMPTNAVMGPELIDPELPILKAQEMADAASEMGRHASGDVSVKGSIPETRLEANLDGGEYQRFLDDKVQRAPKMGFDVALEELHPILKPHQKAIVRWAIQGGRRAIFASFGLGKTLMQLEILRQIQRKTGGRCLIVCPLGVRQEFVNDAAKLGAEQSLDSEELDSEDIPA